MGFDLVGLINSFATGTYSVLRRTSGGFTRGVANPTVDVTISIRASVQPATGKDLLRLPELRRSNETRVVFTTTQLMVGDQADPNEADIIMIDGERWEIQHCETWVHSSADIVGYHCIAQAPTDGDG